MESLWQELGGGPVFLMRGAEQWLESTPFAPAHQGEGQEELRCWLGEQGASLPVPFSP